MHGDFRCYIFTIQSKERKKKEEIMVLFSSGCIYEAQSKQTENKLKQLTHSVEHKF